MEIENGLTKDPKMAVFLLVFSIFIMASSIHVQGIDGILSVDDFWETLIFFTGAASGLISLVSLVWVALR
ncbi:hypothetical protein [Natrinema altunense]|uniref:hypothetical protein n=1 Tax=Natrinema altunense TaxID=222984 RepID=UPI001184DBF8|nr:hypothetical protein [Natrinema altunense]